MLSGSYISAAGNSMITITNGKQTTVFIRHNSGSQKRELSGSFIAAAGNSMVTNTNGKQTVQFLSDKNLLN